MTSKIRSKHIHHIASAAWQPHIIQSKQALSRALNCCRALHPSLLRGTKITDRRELINTAKINTTLIISKLYRANMLIAERSIAAKAVTLSWYKVTKHQVSRNASSAHVLCPANPAEPRAAKFCRYCVHSHPALQAKLLMPFRPHWAHMLCPLSPEALLLTGKRTASSSRVIARNEAISKLYRANKPIAESPICTGAVIFVLI